MCHPFIHNSLSNIHRSKFQRRNPGFESPKRQKDFKGNFLIKPFRYLIIKKQFPSHISNWNQLIFVFKSYALIKMIGNWCPYAEIQHQWKSFILRGTNGHFIFAVLWLMLPNEREDYENQKYKDITCIKGPRSFIV